jgi:hypothetical protein
MTQYIYIYVCTYRFICFTYTFGLKQLQLPSYPSINMVSSAASSGTGPSPASRTELTPYTMTSSAALEAYIQKYIEKRPLENITKAMRKGTKADIYFKELRDKPDTAKAPINDDAELAEVAPPQTTETPIRCEICDRPTHNRPCPVCAIPLCNTCLTTGGLCECADQETDQGIAISRLCENQTSSELD